MPKKQSQITAGADAAARLDAVPFEQAIERVEEIVAAMESDQLALEQMLVQYEEGSRLLALCQQRIDAAQKRVEIVARQRGKGGGEVVSLQPFEKEAEPSDKPQPHAAKRSQRDDDQSSNEEGSDEVRLF